MRKKKRMIFSSIVIGILTFGLVGFSIFNILVRLGILQQSHLSYIFISIGAIFGAYLGFQSPVSTELISFGITLLIAVQAFWDTAYDIQNGFQEPRVFAGIVAILIFILNTFTGVFRKGTAKKQAKKLIGL